MADSTGGKANDEIPLASVRRIPASPAIAPAQSARPGAARGAANLPASRFEEQGLIGKGGSGEVVRVFDKNILRNVAIKIPALDLNDEGREVDRFVAEGRITGQLEHPNIPPVYEFGAQDDGRPYLAMKLVDGETLDVVLARVNQGRLEPDALADFLHIFVKVSEAVSYAHNRGVIHRDLKPQNIMISDFGQVYVVDWGIARLTPGAGGAMQVCIGNDALHAGDAVGGLYGTFGYMAPEQLQGRNDALDARTDVFGLGATLYQILTGHAPLDVEAMLALRAGRPSPPIRPPEETAEGERVPRELARIAMRALAFDPKDRYQTVVDLKRDVEAFQRGAWHLPRMTVPAGTVIVEEGAAGDVAYVIEEGSCVAYRVHDGEELVLRVMRAGEVFGETAVFSEKPRTASVKAVTDVVLVAVTREALSRAMGLNSWMGAFVKALADRFREVDEKLRTFTREAPSRTRPGA